MTEVTIDQLFTIAEASQALDGAEEKLRTSDHEVLADALQKLQQDAGLQIAKEMGSIDPAQDAPGPSTAVLSIEFKPVTTDRLGILERVKTALAGTPFETSVSGLIDQLDIQPIPVIPVTPPNGISPSV